MMTTFRLTGLTLAVVLVMLSAGCGKPEKLETTSGGYREVAPPIELIAKAKEESEITYITLEFVEALEREAKLYLGDF